ncbi:MAG TPA: Lrp/AsnC family transcriptional regulator [Xanthobacteraceae bacterium]|jgi:DNA-binding Lrp family transcriptional regulator|uniref:Lrp/AsnC family transcriptional regulator n=1 Tax=Roseixanthobacter finlandensis TaxID=3119922 RepID=UPI000BCE2DFC|nr:MAG: AsnC family transcriptional regulator [Rhizobiales bacterium 35-66-30]OZA96787.1 MAG: AsnC family transcriptional regulator [Rhizobiales bacterium 39-66-18]HQS07928.1 Lrp/AsnC family transcriptional regulator [Xanthobacteraceae bacterium]HQS45779.1 Lrp/AsnC family transcriptional regulator [Xanthobacteraceae bacterium]
MASSLSNQRADLDAFDIAILTILQKDNTTPQRTIGERVNLSAAAVQRRIKRMRETGVIAGDVTILNPARVGQPLTLVVEVVVESERIDLVDAAKANFVRCPEVQQCYYVTGDADFVLIVTVPTMADYEDLTRRLFFENSNIKRFRTLVVMDRVKTGLTVPLER